MDFIQSAAMFLLQLAVIFITARISGELTVRWFRQPAVLGELIAGMILGPYALGGFIAIPGHGALFPLLGGATAIPIDRTLFIVAEFAAVILLFMAGLETDFGLFVKYAGPATVVAAGGVVVPFFFGAASFVYFGFAQSFTSPSALFMGAIMTATSVGITARILSDIKKIGTPEGVTILAGAVVDDVFGILILSIVIAFIKATSNGIAMDVGAVIIVAAKAVGFWIAIVATGIVIAKPFEKFVSSFKTHGARLVLSLSLCLIASAAAEFCGLAMIIGAYAMGLVLSRTSLAKDVITDLTPVYQVLVPSFFVVTGMMVDFTSVGGVLLAGAVVSVLAIFSKLAGCGLAAMSVGFNKKGALRIGVGMVPRGEVALIVAMTGMASGIIAQAEYSIAIMMTLVTTIVAPIFLGPVFAIHGSGRLGKESPIATKAVKEIVEELKSQD